MKNKTKVYVGMSGGVDSSVAAYLLNDIGYEVHGIFANCFYDDAQCRNSDDHKDAVKIASSLNIKLETYDYRQTYHDNVLKNFYSEYANGRTPNPDIACNSEIKFGVMANEVFKLSQDAYLATGHYVGSSSLAKSQLISLLGNSSKSRLAIDEISGLIYSDSSVCRTFLLSGKDVMKDQSYFLYRIYDKTENLDRYIFPLSEMTKQEVRSLAQNIGIDIANKPDSQGICFIGDIKLREFIKDHVKALEGKVVDVAGNTIGAHSGIQFYTIGQRHGFKIDSYKGEPLYIVDKILDQNILVVGNREQASSNRFIISELCFPYNIENFLDKFNEVGLTVRVRNLGKKIPCKVREIFPDNYKVGNKNLDKKYEVELLEPEFGVSPGQSAVFYVDRLMLGGGVIESSFKKYF
jgi:tRNA-specific 2-thiouridylase